MSAPPFVAFNRPHVTGGEFDNIQQAILGSHLSGNGPFTNRCCDWLREATGTSEALLTHSCTAALELCALLAELEPGDEVIMPSFTFVSTANAFALRGAVPVFVDVREDTANLDERLVEDAVTDRTRAIVAVHYAGVGCEMDALAAIAQRHGLLLVEDAAQGLMATYRGRPLGGIGDLGALSFHETKNVHCGEGGALLVNVGRLADRAHVLVEKGTNRRQFYLGQVDKYSWMDLGSSYLPSEINAAFLWAQLSDAEGITARRLRIWDRYHAGLASLEAEGRVTLPTVPEHCRHNAHMYHLVLPEGVDRGRVLTELRERGVDAVFHYVPLHSAPASRLLCRTHGELPQTERFGSRLFRLPLWPDIPDAAVDQVIAAVGEVLR